MSGLIRIQTVWSQMVKNSPFLKEFFEKVDFEKNQQTTKQHAKLPSRQRVPFAAWKILIRRAELTYDWHQMYNQIWKTMLFWNGREYKKKKWSTMAGFIFLFHQQVSGHMPFIYPIHINLCIKPVTPGQGNFFTHRAIIWRKLIEDH